MFSGAWTGMLLWASFLTQAATSTRRELWLIKAPQPLWFCQLSIRKTVTGSWWIEEMAFRTLDGGSANLVWLGEQLSDARRLRHRISWNNNNFHDIVVQCKNIQLPIQLNTYFILYKCTASEKKFSSWYCWSRNILHNVLWAIRKNTFLILQYDLRKFKVYKNIL